MLAEVHARSAASRPGLSRRFFREMRTEGEGAAREAAALGLGVFIGCTPLYGLHLVLVLAAGSVLRLNRLKMYIAANISNPLLAPLLVLTEVQAGAWLRRRQFHELSLEAVRTTDPWTFGSDLLLGSLAVGVAGGLLVAGLTWITSRRSPGDDEFERLCSAAAERYLRLGIVAWEFARGKLRGDPVYRAAVFGGLLRGGEVLVDVGCGQGLMLAILAEARRHAAGSRGGSHGVFRELVGVELRPRIAQLAADALAGEARVYAGDARGAVFTRADAVLLFDVLHMMPADAQSELLQAIARQLPPGGMVLVREADAAAGWRFTMVRVGNRLKALATGNWGQRFAFRSGREWQGVFEKSGFSCDARSMAAGTPFGNVLFALTAPARSPQSSQPA